MILPLSTWKGLADVLRTDCLCRVDGLLPIYEFHKCERRYRGNRRVLRDVVGRRWQDLLDGQTHDFVVPLSGMSWLVFQRRRVLAGDHAVHWYVERGALPADEIPGVGVVQNERIARTLAYIHDHFGESPGFEQFTAAAHISLFHFHRLFSKPVGASPKQYLQSKRLQSDRWLLSTARKSVADIARTTGFASHGHFTSTFRRVVGQSPKAYHTEIETRVGE